MAASDWFRAAGAVSRDLDAAGGQAAHRPVRFRRVIEPRLDPTLVDAALYGAFVEALTLSVEKRQPSFWFIKPAPQIRQLSRRGALAPCRKTQHTRRVDTIRTG